MRLKIILTRFSTLIFTPFHKNAEKCSDIFINGCNQLNLIGYNRNYSQGGVQFIVTQDACRAEKYMCAILLKTYINTTYDYIILDGIVKYMRSKAGPASRDLRSLIEVQSFLKKDELAVVGEYIVSGMAYWLDLVNNQYLTDILSDLTFADDQCSKNC